MEYQSWIHRMIENMEDLGFIYPPALLSLL